MSALAGYVRHAERFGTELVFETAAGLVWPFRPDLSVRELGSLALRLRNLEPKWKPPTGEDGAFEVRGLDGGDFALLLVAEGVRERDAARTAGISVRTLQRRQRPAREVLEQVACEPKQARKPAFQSGENATNQGSEGGSGGWADFGAPRPSDRLGGDGAMSEPLRLHPDDLERFADLVVDRLAVKIAAPAAPTRLLSAREVAERLGLSRDAIYGMADELGAVRIGSGPRPRLRFPPDAVDRWSARDEQKGSQPPSPGPDSAPHRASRRRASRASATAVELLPIRRPTGGAS